jgi:hypothetical protein
VFLEEKIRARYYQSMGVSFWNTVQYGHIMQQHVESPASKRANGWDSECACSAGAPADMGSYRPLQGKALFLFLDLCQVETGR